MVFGDRQLGQGGDFGVFGQAGGRQQVVEGQPHGRRLLHQPVEAVQGWLIEGIGRAQQCLRPRLGQARIGRQPAGQPVGKGNELVIFL